MKDSTLFSSLRILFFLLLFSFLIGLVVFKIYILAQPLPIKSPEKSAFNLTLFIFIISELTFVIGLFVLDARRKFDPFILFFYNKINQSKNKFIIYLCKIFIFAIVPISMSWLATYVCYQIYEFFVRTPPIENLGFGMLLFFVMLLVFVFSFVLGVFVNVRIFNKPVR